MLRLYRSSELQFDQRNNGEFKYSDSDLISLLGQTLQTLRLFLRKIAPGYV